MQFVYGYNDVIDDFIVIHNFLRMTLSSIIYEPMTS